MPVTQPTGHNRVLGTSPSKLNVTSRILIVVAIAGLVALVLLLFLPIAEAVFAGIGVIVAALVACFPILRSPKEWPHLSRPIVVEVLSVVVLVIIASDAGLAGKALHSTPEHSTSATPGINKPTDHSVHTSTPTLSSAGVPTRAFAPQENQYSGHIEAGHSQEIFGDELIISVREVSYRTWVTAAIRSPGYDAGVIERVPVGHSMVYRAKHNFEVVVTDFDVTGSVAFRVTRLDQSAGPDASPTFGTPGRTPVSSPTLRIASPTVLTSVTAVPIATPSSTIVITEAAAESRTPTFTLTTMPPSAPESTLPTRTTATAPSVLPNLTPTRVDLSTISELVGDYNLALTKAVTIDTPEQWKIVRSYLCNESVWYQVSGYRLSLAEKCHKRPDQAVFESKRRGLAFLEEDGRWRIEQYETWHYFAGKLPTCNNPNDSMWETNRIYNYHIAIPPGMSLCIQNYEAER
jgi:hypothetical protein